MAVGCGDDNEFPASKDFVPAVSFRITGGNAFDLITGRVGHSQFAARAPGTDLTVPAAKGEAVCGAAAKVTGARMMATDSPQVTLNLPSDSVGELYIIVEVTHTGQPSLAV